MPMFLEGWLSKLHLEIFLIGMTEEQREEEGGKPSKILLCGKEKRGMQSFYHRVKDKGQRLLILPEE